MVFELRPYQSSALAALDDYWAAGGGSPLISMPTGTGKALLIAWLIREVLAKYPDLRILVAQHVQELIEQNLEHLIALWPDAPVGVNCDALGQRDWDHPVLFASIQSIFRSPRKLGRRNLMLIDEAHLIPHEGDGMYRSLIAALRVVYPEMRCAGFTATAFRLDTGRLDQGEGKIFDKIVFNYDIGQAIKDGWLAPLSSKATTTKLDVSKVGRRGGEFIESELQSAVDTDAIVAAACDEIVAQGADRKSWLIFCTGVAHGEHVRDALRVRNINAKAVFGETSQEERKRIIDGFKAGKIRALVNVGVLTTGFNAPAVDLLAMLRPTLSTGLYVQMIGRGTRKVPGKVDCRILDFAGNVMRHGPVNTIDLNNIETTGTREESEDRGKVCPNCKEINPRHVTNCIECDYAWPRPEMKVTHAPTAVVAPVLLTEQTWIDVDRVTYALHRKRLDPTAPPSLRVDYLCGLRPHSEYVSLERPGYPRHKAEQWWRAIGGDEPVPATVAEALDRTSELDDIIAVTIRRNGDFWNVVEHKVRRPNDSIEEIDANYRVRPPPQPRLSLKEEMKDEVAF